MGNCISSTATTDTTQPVTTHAQPQPQPATTAPQRGARSRRGAATHIALQPRASGSSHAEASRRTPPPTDPRMQKMAGDRFFTIDRYATHGLADRRYLLDDARRARIEVHIRDGRLYQLDNNNVLAPMNTEPYSMFVMAGNGRLYAAPPGTVYNHTGFMAGGRVAAAGELTVKDGVILHIDNQSGHYAPSIECHAQVLRRLASDGVPLPRPAESAGAPSWLATSGQTVLRA